MLQSALMNSLIQVRNLKKCFTDICAVNDVSFDVVKGECLGILGPNGAGKTTTVRIIQCLSPKSDGEVAVFGMPAQINSRAIKARLGVVPQLNDLDVDMTVWQNLTLFALFFDIPRSVAEERIIKYLKFFEVYDRRDSMVRTLSGGMRQRVLIARALVNDPDLLMLDEPTTGLDPQIRHVIWQKLQALKEQGKTIIITTHYMDEAEKLCDRLLIMDKGRIIREGVPQQLVKDEVGTEVTDERFGKKYVRPANLEDVFLKLTGHGLEVGEV